MVYLIHFDTKLHHAQHYLGYTENGNLQKRLHFHRTGNGSRLMAAVTAAAITWQVVRIWEDADRHFERRLKNEKHLKRHCPVCKELQCPPEKKR